MIDFNFFNFSDYRNIFILFFISSILSFCLIFFSFILINQFPDSEKLSVYECGYEPYDNTRHIFNINFYLIALLFVIFDIEILFLIPWCIFISEIDLLSFWSMIDFIFELSIGFFYLWYFNSLDWE